MSVPPLHLSTAVKNLSLNDFDIQDRGFYKALEGEETFAYIMRIMGQKSGFNSEIIANFLDRIKCSKVQDVFFQEALRNIPRLEIRDGYRIKLEGTLAGKVFTSLCPVKINFFLEECRRRRPNSTITIEQWVYLQNHLAEMHECPEKRAIEDVLKMRASEPQFELKRIVWMCHEGILIDEKEVDNLAKLGVCSPELFIFTQTHFIESIKHWSRKSLVKILTLEGKKELLEYLKSAPAVADFRYKTSLLEKVQNCETLLDYKCTTGQEDQDFFQLDAEFFTNWQAGPGQKYPLATIHKLATLALDASNRLLSTRVFAREVFSKTLVSSAVGDETLRNHVIDLIKEIFALYHYDVCSEEDLEEKCEGFSHFIFSHQIFTYFIFNSNTKELVVKNNETGELKSAKVPRFLATQDKLLLSDRVSALFSGNAFEMKCISHSQVKAMEDEHWDSWQSDDHESWQLYRAEIHPLIHSAAVSILRKSQSQDLIVMEVCGGSGALALEICKYVQKPFSYILLERNAESLSQAKKAITKKHVHLVQTDVIADEHYYFDQEKTIPIQQGSVAVCIGSGALTKSVLNNKGEALIVLDKIIGYLKSGGYLLLAGLTSSLLHSSDFSGRGLRIINTHASGYRPMYILQKP